jgi:manganese transport protein
MQGFVGFSIPVWLRRLVTMLPTLVIIAWGVNPTQALIISQVVLSLVLPIPVVSLLVFTRKKELMGDLVNRRLTTAIAFVAAGVILCLNLVLLAQVAGLTLSPLSSL